MAAPEQNPDGSLVDPRVLTPAEYEATYATGSGGHRLSPEQAAALQRLADSQLAFERDQRQRTDGYADLSDEERAARNIGTPNPDHVEPGGG